MFNKMSNWSLNKNDPNAITYVYGKEIVRITLEAFIADGGTKTDFIRLKKVSDEMFHDEDNLEVNEYRNRISLESAERNGECFAKSPEELLTGRNDNQAQRRQFDKLKPLATLALNSLTEVQRRRYLLHFRDKLTVRQIAELEGVKHPSVVESLQAAGRKIQAFIGENAPQA